MTESWEDIVGSLEKPEKNSLPKKRRQASYRHAHEPEERTAVRRAKALEAIFTIMPNSIISENGTVHSELHGKKFDFWPSSDCWFAYSTQKYGHDIERLCEQICKWALGLEKKKGK